MRKLSEIYDSIVTNIAAQQELLAIAPLANFGQLVSDFVSVSRVAVWRMMSFCMAAAIYKHESLFELFKAEIAVILKDVSVGTADWYVGQVLDFQVDTPLSVLETGRVGYENSVVDVVKKIINKASVEEDENGVLRIKVAKLVSSNLVALTANEQVSLEAYFKKVRFAGTRFTIVSTNGDFIQFGAIRITHNGLNADATIQKSVRMVLKNRITSLPFNGRLWVVRLVDALQAIDGVVDVVLEAIQVSSDGIKWTPMARFHTPVGGYFRASGVENLNIIINVVYE